MAALWAAFFWGSFFGEFCCVVRSLPTVGVASWGSIQQLPWEHSCPAIFWRNVCRILPAKSPLSPVPLAASVTTAARFAREGMKVVLADIEEAALDQAVQELADAGHEIIGVPTDVSSWEAIQALAMNSGSSLTRSGRTPCKNAWQHSPKTTRSAVSALEANSHGGVNTHNRASCASIGFCRGSGVDLEG